MSLTNCAAAAAETKGPAKDDWSAAMTKPEEALVTECAARVREKVRQSVKDDAVNLAAMALLVVALASCVHPTDWAAFCHVLQFVCVIGAVALLFWNWGGARNLDLKVQAL